MRTTQCVRAGWLIGAVGACMLVAGAARADVTTERPGSILIFPKVVCNGTRDTVIQISNTSNVVDQARCFYINGAKGRTGVAQCNETDFFISLTKQQPTSWQACSGRSPIGFDGLGPGLVPPVPAGFTGALVCAEVDASLAPVAMNALKGEATLEGSPGNVADLSKYNGIAVLGNTSGANNSDNDLNLNGVEYNACPATSRVNFVAAEAPDPIIPGLSGSELPSSVTTTVTVLPCNLDMNAQVPTAVALTFAGAQGDETSFSGSRNISCWDSFTIDSSLIGAVPTEFGTLTIKSGKGGPVLAVVETLHSDGAGNTASAAFNTHMEGQCVGTCTAPAGAPCLTNSNCSGTCSGTALIGNACSSNVDCGLGACSGPRFCAGGTTAGRSCTKDVDCSGGTCPLPAAVIRLPGA